jgi:hypothetical protein
VSYFQRALRTLRLRFHKFDRRRYHIGLVRIRDIGRVKSQQGQHPFTLSVALIHFKGCQS